MKGRGKTDTMPEELITLQSAFRGLSDEDDEEETKEIPLDEDLEDDSETDDDEEEELQ